MDPQAFDFILEIAGHVVGAMIVTQFQSTRHAQGRRLRSTGAAERKPTLLLEIRQAGRHSAKNLTRLLLNRGETRQRGHLTR